MLQQTRVDTVIPYYERFLNAFPDIETLAQANQESVLKRWEGQSLSVLFTVMSTSMPESNPGFLSEKEYVDVLAYILSLSRYAAGETELDYKDGALNEVTVEARQRK